MSIFIYNVFQGDRYFTTMYVQNFSYIVFIISNIVSCIELEHEYKEPQIIMTL